MRIPVLAIAVFVLAGCGGGSYSSSTGPTSPQYASVAGAWQATATSTTFPQADPILVEVNLTQSAGAISLSQGAAANTCVASIVEIQSGTGTVTGNSVSFTSTFSGETVVLTGTVSGSTMSGTYTASGACAADAGTWSATLMPHLSGTYSGNVFSDSAPNTAIPVSSTVSSDTNFAITGNLSLSSICFSQLTLTGKQVGGAALITGSDTHGNSVTYVFISQDAQFGTLSGNYEVTAGTCAGDTGHGTVTKQ